MKKPSAVLERRQNERMKGIVFEGILRQEARKTTLSEQQKIILFLQFCINICWILHILYCQVVHMFTPFCGSPNSKDLTRTEVQNKEYFEIHQAFYLICSFTCFCIKCKFLGKKEQGLPNQNPFFLFVYMCMFANLE